MFNSQSARKFFDFLIIERKVILMAMEEYKLKPLSVVSQLVQIKWNLKILARLIGVPKKHLKRAIKIIKTPVLEAEIVEKGKLVKRTFHYGFRRFILKKRGKEREILAPHPEVQFIFRKIKEWLDRTVCCHEKAFGFVKNRNHKKAVEALLGNKHFFSFDIADAFPSIDIKMIEKAFIGLGIVESAAEILAWFVTYYYQCQRRLPQGASSSPSLLNLVYKPMCEEIDEFCRKNNINWAVYADDFNFAGENISPEAKKELLSIPAKYGFKIKPEKNKDNFGRTIPHLLGLTIVNGKIHIKRRQKKKFRRILYATIKHNAYSQAKARGTLEAIQCIYGDMDNWPGWLWKFSKTSSQ